MHGFDLDWKFQIVRKVQRTVALQLQATKKGKKEKENAEINK